MKAVHLAIIAACTVLVTGCATVAPTPAPPARPAPEPPKPADAPPPPPPPTAQPSVLPPATPIPSASAREVADEARRLTGMQKKYFTVFKIDEAGSGLKARANAIGVFDLRRPPRGDRLRLIVTQASSKPARLTVGTYSVALDTVIDFVETQTCRSASCAGKQQKFVRSLKKVYKIGLSPRNEFYGGQDISLATPGTPGNYRSAYSDVVVTVRRITVTPQGVGG